MIFLAKLVNDCQHVRTSEPNPKHFIQLMIFCVYGSISQYYFSNFNRRQLMDFDELKRYMSKTKSNEGKEKNAGLQN